jgi:uncharacterized damage-inducible protein DinB
VLSELLSRNYRRNQRVIHAHADGISHEESLTQTEYNVNCLNWVLGHIVVGRSDLLSSVFDLRPLLSDGEAGPYRRESDPITADGPGVISFERLLDLLDDSQSAIETALEQVDDPYLLEEVDVDGERSATRLAQVMFTYFHDTYHTGQTDLLRQMSGKSDTII